VIGERGNVINCEKSANTGKGGGLREKKSFGKRVVVSGGKEFYFRRDFGKAKSIKRGGERKKKKKTKKGWSRQAQTTGRS